MPSRGRLEPPIGTVRSLLCRSGLSFLERQSRCLRATFKSKMVLEEATWALEQESFRLLALAGEGEERGLSQPQRK